MPDRFAVMGHPLAAEENRLAFTGWEGARVDLIVPEAWRSPSLGHAYRAETAEGGAGRPHVHALPVGLNGRNSLFFWTGLARCLRQCRPDVLYCWEEPWCVSALQAAIQARNLGVTLVFYSAENKPKRLPLPFRNIRSFVYARARAAIAPTQEIADNLRASGYAGEIRVVPLWIRPRRRLEAEADGKCLAYVGRLIPLKRVDLLVQALADLPGYRLRILGDGPEMPRLRALAHTAGVTGRVDFRGHVDNGDLESALQGASLLALPTGENARQAEQFGKAALEGVACGLPVLASRTGNLAQLSRALPTVFARDVDSPQAMAAAIADVFAAYPDARARAGARETVLREYGPAAAGRALAQAFTAFARERKTA